MGREITDSEADAICRQIFAGILAGSCVCIKFHFATKPGAQEIAAIERAVNGLVVDLLREELKCEVPDRLLRVDLLNCHNIDDGDENGIVITLDFGELLPGERTEEMKRYAEGLVHADQT